MSQVQILPLSNNEKEITYRHADSKDLYAIHKILTTTVADLSYRIGASNTKEAPGDDVFEKSWISRHSLYRHLFTTSEQVWIAELAGEIIGFSRSIRRGDMLELTELFVLPSIQSKGVGRQLFNLAFMIPESSVRCIIATPDVRAQALYLNARIHQRFAIYTFSRKPEMIVDRQDLSTEIISNSNRMLNILDEIDRAVIGHQRTIDHKWLMSNRKGFLYLKQGEIIGYGYIGSNSGPFALYDPIHFPDVLKHAETVSAIDGYHEFAIDVPMTNTIAVQYLLSRNYHMSPFYCYLMSDVEFGQFYHYIITAPSLFI